MNSPTLHELTPIMQEVLGSGGTIKLQPRGISMVPFIRPERDEVFLVRPEQKLTVGNVYLYRRKNGKLVLHRLVKIRGEELIFRGDHQIHREVGISPSQLVGVVTNVKRNGRNITNKCLAYYWFQAIAFPWCVLTRVIHKLRIKFLKRRQKS